MFADKSMPVLYAECNTRQSVCRVFLVLCRVHLALGKSTVSRSAGAQARTTHDIGRLSPHDDSGLTWPIPCGIRDSTAQRLAVVAVASLAPLIFHNLEEFSFSAKKKKKKKNSQFGSNVEGVYPDS